MKALKALWLEAQQRNLLSDDPEELEENVRPLLAEMTDEVCRGDSDRHGVAGCGARLPRWCLDGRLCPRCRDAQDRELSDRERRTVERMAKIGVPPAYQHCTLETYDGAAPDEWGAWVASPSGFFVLMAPDTGVGKTHLATAALYSLDSSGRRCFWAPATEMARRMSAEAFDPEQPTYRKSCRVEILLIDDLGAEVKIVHNGPQLVDSVLEERDRHKRPTIVTTNLTVEQLYERNPRLASRLGQGRVIDELKGLDRRIHR